VEKQGKLDPKGYAGAKYGKSTQLRFIADQPLLPIGYIQTKNALCRRKDINQYTPEGRASIHKNLRFNMLESSKFSVAR
jgi:hypothetical protein